MAEFFITDEKVAWPPPYQIRRSARAKRILFQITASGTLEVVIPNRCALKAIEPALNAVRPWVEKQLEKTSREPVVFTLPSCITLSAINEDYPVTYLKQVFKPSVAVLDDVLFVSEITESLAERKRLLIDWIQKKARRHLVPWLYELANEYGFDFNQVSIRGQKSLWGSCTADKNISLNYKLLFLPERLTRHILLHELCHTVHLDHSDRFWKLLGKIDEGCAEYRKLSREAHQLLPRWLGSVKE